jgi:uncharacterized membrane protein YozB (DUF420 family)
LHKPKKLIALGIVLLAIVVAAALTSRSWAPEDAALLIVLFFPVLLAGATLPVAIGGIALFRDQGSANRRKMDLAVAVTSLVLAGGVVCYLVFFFTT